MPAALRGQALQRTPPFLESSFPPTAMSGGHAGPAGRLFFLTAAAAALPPHSLFLLFLPSLPPWASGQSPGPWGRGGPWPVCRVPFTRPLRRSWKKREARTASWERSVRPAHAPPLSSAGPALSPGGLVCEASREEQLAPPELSWRFSSWSIDGVARSGWAFCLPADARVGCLADVARCRRSFPSLRLIGSVLGTFECCQFCPWVLSLLPRVASV